VVELPHAPTPGGAPLLVVGVNACGPLQFRVLSRYC
jgi:hypothetical protein